MQKPLNRRSLVLDFETRSMADLGKVGADNYSKDPSTDALCVGFAYGDDAVDILKPGDFEFAPFLDFVRLEGRVSAWNVPFELAIWNNVMVRRYGWPILRPEQCECLMAASYAMSMPGKLEKAAPAFGIDQRKDMAGNRVMLQLAQPRTTDPLTWWTEDKFPEKYQALYDYCLADVIAERELKKRMMALSPFEQKIWQLDYRINQRGIQIDQRAVQTALTLVTSEKARLNERIRAISSGAIATCTAVAQIGKYLATRGVDIQGGIAKAEVTELLSRTDLPPDCREVLILRQEAGKSSTAKLETMLGRAGKDGRLRGMFQYHGATTGRWAGRGVQLHNIPRPKISQNDIEGVFDILEKV